MGVRDIKRVGEYHYVYAFRCERFVKIGISGNPKGRIRTVSQTVPYDVSFVKVFRFDTRKQASFVERESHLLLYRAGKLHKGEWFIGSDAEIISAIEFVIKDLKENPITKLTIKPRNLHLIAPK